MFVPFLKNYLLFLMCFLIFQHATSTADQSRDILEFIDRSKYFFIQKSYINQSLNKKIITKLRIKFIFD